MERAAPTGQFMTLKTFNAPKEILSEYHLPFVFSQVLLISTNEDIRFQRLLVDFTVQWK